MPRYFERYFETEIPETVITEHGEFRFYKEAKRLQMSKPKWKNISDELVHGKSVSLDVSKFKGNEELKKLLHLVLAEIS